MVIGATQVFDQLGREDVANYRYFVHLRENEFTGKLGTRQIVRVVLFVRRRSRYASKLFIFPLSDATKIRW